MGISFVFFFFFFFLLTFIFQFFSCLAEAWKFAKEWDLGRLKQMVVAKHASYLNSNTVYELLKSADTFSAMPLKRQCTAVAHGNLQDFISQKV